MFRLCLWPASARLLCLADEASTAAGESETKAARAPRAVRVRVDFIVIVSM